MPLGNDLMRAEAKVWHDDEVRTNPEYIVEREKPACCWFGTVAVVHLNSAKPVVPEEEATRREIANLCPVRRRRLEEDRGRGALRDLDQSLAFACETEAVSSAAWSAASYAVITENAAREGYTFGHQRLGQPSAGAMARGSTSWPTQCAA